ncbi:hypothetical protein BsWGS_17016 [Bradybaena similaris]
MSRQRPQSGATKGVAKFFKKFSCRGADISSDDYPQSTQPQFLNPLVVGRNDDFCQMFAQPMDIGSSDPYVDHSTISRGGQYDTYSVHSSDFSESSRQQTYPGHQERSYMHSDSYGPPHIGLNLDFDRPQSDSYGPPHVGLNLDFDRPHRSNIYKEDSTVSGPLDLRAELAKFSSTLRDMAPAGDDYSLHTSDFDMDLSNATDLEPASHIFREIPDEGEYTGQQPLMSTPTYRPGCCESSPVTPRTFRQREAVNDSCYASPIPPVDTEDRFFAYPPYNIDDLLERKKR